MAVIFRNLKKNSQDLGEICNTQYKIFSLNLQHIYSAFPNKNVVFVYILFCVGGVGVSHLKAEFIFIHLNNVACFSC